MSNVKQPAEFTIESVIDAIKSQWIKDFGSLNGEEERNGYFVCGFVETALKLLIMEMMDEATERGYDKGIKDARYEAEM